MTTSTNNTSEFLKIITFSCMLFVTITLLQSCGGGDDKKAETVTPAADSTKKDSTVPAAKDSTTSPSDSGKGVTGGGTPPRP
jgi:hypothetical protein